MTFRAVETLKSCDYILCEDTRKSGVLLKHYEICVPKKSYHKFNERAKLDGILQDLQDGKNIALITDAGTPGIADPSARLVTACHENEVEVTSLPGACALVTALSLLGTLDKQFQFVGFLPKKPGALGKMIKQMEDFDGPSIAYVSPHSVHRTLKAMNPESSVFIAREISKKFEECLSGTPEELLEKLPNPRGEFVIIL